MEGFNFPPFSEDSEAWLRNGPVHQNVPLQAGTNNSHLFTDPTHVMGHFLQSVQEQQPQHPSHPQYGTTYDQPSHSESLQASQVQLEVLRETRRIRELELQIAEEKRRESETRLKEREADVALAEAQVRLRAMEMESRSTSFQDFGGSVPSQTPDGQFARNFESSPSTDDASGFSSNSGAWLDPSLSGMMFPDFFAPDTSTFPSLTSAASDPSPSGPSTSSHVDAGGPSDQLFVSLAPPSDPSSLGKPRRTQVSNSRKKGKGTRAVDECDAFCAQCHKFIAKLLLRGSQEELDVSYDLYHRCSTCAPLGHGSSTRKRANEPDDTASPTICDVCNRIQGFGGFNAKDSRTILAFSVEVVCASCSNKYRRCTNCGGGSARGGIGKWRCKEIFEDDRKTCRLSHERLGGRDMELAVWDILTELPGRQDLPQVIGAIESLWHDHVIARMGVPEVLEYQSVRTYEEIKAKILDLHFPGRSLFTNQAPVPGRRLLLALTWAKMRARRDKSKPLWAQSRPQDKSIHEWVAYNTRRSNVLYPANSLLCGVWIAEWNIADRTLLMGTVCMFDYLDVEDRSAYSFEEFMQRILCEIKEHNASHPEDPWHPPEHLWAAIKSNPYSLRMRLVETLERRLGFMPVQEYLTRYPGVKRELFTADSALLAKAINDRVSVDNKDMTIIVKYVGVSTLEGLERKKAVRLAKPHKAEAKYD